MTSARIPLLSTLARAARLGVALGGRDEEGTAISVTLDPERQPDRRRRDDEVSKVQAEALTRPPVEPVPEHVRERYRRGQW